MMSDEKNYSMDLEILVGFVDEASDSLTKAVDDLLTVGRKGYDDNLVQSVFRAFHSIKGNSAFFGLFPIKTLSHALEQVLDRLRKKELPADHDVIDPLIDGASVLSTCFSRVRTGGIDAIDTSDISPALNRLHAVIERKQDADMTLKTLLDDLVRVEKNEKNLAQVIEKLSRFVQGEENTDDPEQLRGMVPKTGPEYARRLINLLQSPEKGILPEARCDEIEAEILVLHSSVADESQKALIDDLKKDFIMYRKSVGLDPLLREALLDKIALFPEGRSAADPDAPQGETPGQGPAKTMRVSEASVDQFLSYVGELVVVEEMYASLELQMLEGRLPQREIASSLKKTTDIFKGLSRQLQRSIMEIRKVPVSHLFQRMPKIVHDVAREKNKDIEIVMENGHLQVDKNLIETLEAPLIHMVRNAADHGIENPENRKAAGKPDQGLIVLSAEEVGEHIRVTIKDDGAGLNLEKIRNKAVELGIMDPHSDLDEAKIIDVMFHSGVSTAEHVTDISGRGVGMDVVKKNIEDAGGSIRTVSQPGKGTTFTLTLPSSVTTQIIHGFIVRTGSKRCIIPLDTVNGSLSYSSADISTIKGRRQVLTYNNRLIPLNLLGHIVDPGGPESETRNNGSDIIVVTQAGNMEKAYVVDAVEGIRQVVVKPIHQVGGCETRMMSGGAVMGDGTVALILDMEKIMKFDV